MSTRARAAWASVLGVLAFTLYMSNGRLVASKDSLPTAMLPIALLRGDGFYLDAVAAAAGVPSASEVRAANRRDWVHSRWYYLHARGPHVVSAYPVATGILAVPVYFAGALAFGSRTLLHFNLLQKTAAALIAALAVGLFFLLAERIADARAALAGAAILAIATPLWSTASQALWQHGPAVLFMILALIAFHDRRWIAAGLAAGMAVAVRPTMVIFLASLAIAAALEGPRRAIRLVAASVPIGALVAAYNVWAFGSLRGGYFQPFEGNMLVGMAGLLIAPSRGLFIFCPILLLGLWGAWILARRRELQGVYLAAALTAMGLWLLVAAWWNWWGGYSYGPRMMTEAAAALVLLSLPALAILLDRPMRRVRLLAFGAFAWSVFVQVLGAFVYPPGTWDEAPADLRDAPARVWDVRDNLIVRSIEAVGPIR